VKRPIKFAMRPSAMIVTAMRIIGPAGFASSRRGWVIPMFTGGGNLVSPKGPWQLAVDDGKLAATAPDEKAEEAKPERAGKP
jgi:hypothetical protein